jgi:hypothetical protein
VAADYVSAGAGLVGALIGAFAAWGAAIVLERRRENLEVLGALAMLIAEVNENADRARADESASGLTLGVWEHSKPTLAGPGRRAVRDPLWKELHEVYRKIYEAKKSRPVGDADSFRRELEELSQRLAERLRGFEEEIKKWRYWFLPEHFLLRRLAIHDAARPGEPESAQPGKP